MSDNRLLDDCMAAELKEQEAWCRQRDARIERLKAALREMLDAFYPFQGHNAEIYARSRDALAPEQDK